MDEPVVPLIEHEVDETVLSSRVAEPTTDLNQGDLGNGKVNVHVMHQAFAVRTGKAPMVYEERSRFINLGGRCSMQDHCRCDKELARQTQEEIDRERGAYIIKDERIASMIDEMQKNRSTTYLCTASVVFLLGCRDPDYVLRKEAMALLFGLRRLISEVF